MARRKEFDRDEALHKAMEVFWSRGYEATSVGDLVEHMGINRQSLYDTFGDKHSLYLAALDRYREVEGRKLFELLSVQEDACSSPSPVEYITGATSPYSKLRVRRGRGAVAARR